MRRGCDGRHRRRRGLALHPDVIFVTDGGSGLNRALKDRFGKGLKHQRCVIHKRRNIESHLPEMYRAEFNRRDNNAIGMTKYEDAKRELRKVHEWLTGINASAARSLDEGGKIGSWDAIGYTAPGGGKTENFECSGCVGASIPVSSAKNGVIG